MGAHRNIYNVTRCLSLREKFVRKGLKNGAFVWDEQNPGCVRDATLAEKYEALMADAAQRERNAEPLAPAEVAGVVYRPIPGQEKAHYASRQLAADAREFAASASAA